MNFFAEKIIKSCVTFRANKARTHTVLLKNGYVSVNVVAVKQGYRIEN